MESWLTIADAARVAGVSAGTLRRWDRSGRLRAVRHPISGYRMYLREQLTSALPEGEPAPPAPLSGRQTEQRQLEALLIDHRLVTITGPPGIGKTTLLDATLAASPLRTVSVPCVHVQDLDGFVAAVARALEAGAPGGDLPDRLSGQPTLLGLDNLEQLLETGLPGLLVEWLERAPDLRILATSREAVRVRPERCLSLGPLPRDVAFTLVRSSTPTPFSDVQLDTLVRRLEGNPLALQLAASQADLLGAEALLEQLGPDVLVTDARDQPAHHVSMDVAVRSSLARLPPDTLRGLSQLLVFRGGFVASAAQQVLDVPRPLDVLRALRRASLLRATEGDGAPRYTVWAIVSEVVGRTHPPDAHTRERHARWLLDLMDGPADRLSAEAENYRAAVTGPELSASLRARVLCGSEELAKTIPPQERAAIATELLDAVQPAALWLLRARARSEVGQNQQALDDLERGLQLPADGPVRVELLLKRTELYLARGWDDRPEVDGMLDEALTLARVPENNRVLPYAVFVQANRVLHRDGPRSAIPALHEALRTARRHGVPRFELASAAMTCAMEAAVGTARLDFCLEAVALAREMEDRRIEGYALRVVAVVLMEQGRLDDAVRVFEDACTTSEAGGYRKESARARRGQGVAFLLQARFADAHRAFEQSIAVFDPDTPEWQVGVAFVALGTALEGHLERALSLLPEHDPESLGIGNVVRRLCGQSAPPLDPEYADDWLVRAVARLEARPTTSLTVDEDGASFQAPGAPPVALDTHPVLARLLAALAHADTPLDASTLVEVGWPDETLVGDSGIRRVHSAIWKLRSLGLKGYLETTPDGYVLRR